MSETTSPHAGLTRRSFLKTTGAIVGAATLAGGVTSLTALAEEKKTPSKDEEIYASSCRSNCHQACQLNFHVRDGKIVRVSPFDYPEECYNRICSKGYSHIFRTYSQERTKYPLRRAEGTERGSGQWERISWDEAISEITSKIKDARSQFGSGAFTVFYWGSGNYAMANGTATPAYMDRFMTATGCTKIQISTDMGSVQSGQRMGSFQSFPETKKFADAKSIIFWGGNYVLSEPNLMHFLLEAKKKGAKFICIDPNFSLTAAKSDWYIPIRPATDGLLAIAMEKIIIENGWYDEAFLKTQTTAGGLMFADKIKMVRASDLGKQIENDPVMCMDSKGELVPMEQCSDPVLFSQGKIENEGKKLRTSLDFVVEQIDKYSLDDISEKTTIPLNTINELAEYYAKNPSLVFLGYGANHYTNANHTYFALKMLPALTGQYNSEIAGMGTNPAGAADLSYVGLIPPTVPNDPGPVIPTPWMHKAVHEGQWAGNPYHSKVLYIACTDYLNNMSDRAGAIEWMNKFETIIVADPFMTDTARYADYVLPASFWFESEDVQNNQFSTIPMMNYCSQVIDPLYESKSDFEIYNLILHGIGLDDAIIEDRADWFRVVLDTEGCRKMGISYETLKKNRTMRSASDAPEVSKGRFQFATDSAKPIWFNNQNLDLEKELSQPSWEPPVEAWYENEIVEKYPLHAISRRSRYRTHTQWWDVELLNELDREPNVMINPADAEKYGIADGDMMRVYNDRGSFVARTRFSNGTRPGTVFTSRGFQAHQYVEGHHQTILPRYCEDWVQNQAFYDTLVAVEKA